MWMSESVRKRNRVQIRTKHSHAITILEETRESGRAKCVSGVRRDNGDSKGGIMLSSCQ